MEQYGLFAAGVVVLVVTFIATLFGLDSLPAAVELRTVMRGLLHRGVYSPELLTRQVSWILCRPVREADVIETLTLMCDCREIIRVYLEATADDGESIHEVLYTAIRGIIPAISGEADEGSEQLEQGTDAYDRD